MHLSHALTVLAALAPALTAAPLEPSIVNTTPINFAILVFPGFQALDAFGPLDALNSLSAIYLNNSLHLKVVAETLDPVSTIRPKTAMHNMTMGDFGESVVPTHTFKQLQDGGGINDIDVLLVPGGGGTREPRVAELAFIKAAAPKAKYVISVCTGSALLARAGVLDGHRATSNKRAWAWVISTSDKVEWVRKARWVQDGNFWTSSGASAGIDVTYAWVEHVYGKKQADDLAEGLEYRRWTNSSDDPFADLPWSENAVAMGP